MVQLQFEGGIKLCLIRYKKVYTADKLLNLR